MILQKILSLMKEGVKISITGPSGVGKTHTLKKLEESMHGLYLNRLNPRKEKILKIIRFLRENGVSIPRSSRTLEKMKTEDLMEFLKNLKFNREILIFLDDLDRYTPRELELFEILNDKFNVVFSFTEMRKIKKYVYQTKIISLKPLSRKTMEKLLDEHGINDPSTRIQIIERSAGIPGVFFSILKNPESIKTISSHPPKKIDMTWILLSIISFIIIMRFIALGTNDTEKYILAGILYGLSFMFRPFIYKGMRKE